MQRDREGIRKTKRLVLQKILYAIFFNPSHRRYRSSVSPLLLRNPRNIRDTAGVKNKHNTQESINLLLCVLHSKI